MMTTSPSTRLLSEKKMSSYNTIISILLLLTTTTLTPTSIWAYPTGAGTCNAGEFAPVGHTSDALMGSLLEGNFIVSIDDQLLVPVGAATTRSNGEEMIVVEPNMNQKIKISGLDSNTMFRGFLLRVSSSSSDLTATLSNPTDNVDYQIRFNQDEEPDNNNNPEICDSGVAAATHTAGPNNMAYDKNSVEITWNIPSDVIPSEGASTIDIEVTVVVDYSNYFYTKYAVTAESSEEEEEKNNNENSSATTTTTMTITTVMIMTMMNFVLL